MHPLLAGNDTVPISTWLGGGMRSTECSFVLDGHWIDAVGAVESNFGPPPINDHTHTQMMVTMLRCRSQ